MIALVREPDSSILNCELTHLERLPIAFVELQMQHQAYCRSLTALGLEVQFLPALPGSPDGVFVEDTAVVLDELAVITLPGAASRRHETETVAAALAAYRSEIRVLRSGTLDGGDVLPVGRNLFVGLSSRTSPEGVDELRSQVSPFGYEVIALRAERCLHLRTAGSFLGEGTVLANPLWIDLEPFRAFRIIEVDPLEPFAANAIRIGAKVLYPAEYPRTAERLREACFSLHLTPMAEMAKAEAGLTCLSLIFD